VQVRRMGLEPSVEAVRAAYFKRLKSPEETQDLIESLELDWDFDKKFDEYIREKGFRSHNHLKNLRQCKRVFSEYNRNIKGDYISPSTLDKRMVSRITNYLITHCNYLDSTIEKHLAGLRAFLRWACPDKTFTILSYPKPAEYSVVYLREEELHKLIATPLEKGYLDKTRDLLVFLCTTGMRYSDSQEFHYSWVEDGIIDYIQKKTGSNALVPFREVTERIVVKWEGRAPQISSQKFNDYIKVLLTNLGMKRPVKIIESIGGSKKVEYFPLNEIASSHIGRKTFITLSLMSGIPIQDVMRMSGHSDYRAMKPYIDVSKEHLKVSAGRWII
jgi:integrase